MIRFYRIQRFYLAALHLDVAQKLWNGEEIEADEVIETALVSGTDFGIKASAAGALKVGIEKEIISGVASLFGF